jgi:hypothetical protein
VIEILAKRANQLRAEIVSRFRTLPARTRALSAILAVFALISLVDIAITARYDDYFGAGDPRNTPAFTVEDAAVVGWGGSTRRWKLSARRVYMMQDARKAVFKDVEGATLYRDGEPILKIRAKEVQLDMLSHDFDARGMIEIDYMATGGSFTASRMHWDARSERLTTRGGLAIRKNDLQVRAGDLELDMKTGDIRFNSVDIFMYP